MTDGDSPRVILNKITFNVHEQMCPGAHRGEGQTNINKMNQSSNKGNDSYDCKLTDQDLTERVPKINCFNAKINNVSYTNQNSARLAGSSNFQSFKKNAMKLPKVSMRTSLIQ